MNRSSQGGGRSWVGWLSRANPFTLLTDKPMQTPTSRADLDREMYARYLVCRYYVKKRPSESCSCSVASYNDSLTKRSSLLKRLPTRQ